MYERSAGVMANISSLPSAFGIGCFNKDAEDFPSLIASMGFHWWNTLSITTIGDDSSPFTGVSFYAGNPLYISPADLLSRGLITEADLQSAVYHGSEYTVDYAFARENVKNLLCKALDNISPKLEGEIRAFASGNKEWLLDFCRYSCLTKQYGNSWYFFPEEYKFRNKKALAAFDAEHEKDYFYYYFEQYMFYEGWHRIKSRANDIGVGIIGTISAVTPYNNIDVWKNPNEFLIDELGNTQFQIGFAPDAFYREGRVTGMPAYNFAEMSKNKFKTLRNRLTYSLGLYDAVIVNSPDAIFRPWNVPFGADNALDGHYGDGGGRGLLSLAVKAASRGNIIFNYPVDNDNATNEYIQGVNVDVTRIVQFAFSFDSKKHLPHNYSANCVAFTSYYDTNTTLGWLYEMEPYQREAALNYVNYKDFGWGAGGAECTSVKAFVRAVAASNARLMMVPIQDLCGFGDNTRLKSSYSEGRDNWLFRMYYGALNNVDTAFYREINELYERNSAFRG